MSDWIEVHNPLIRMLTISDGQVQKEYATGKIKMIKVGDSGDFSKTFNMLKYLV